MLLPTSPPHAIIANPVPHQHDDTLNAKTPRHQPKSSTNAAMSGPVSFRISHRDCAGYMQDGWKWEIRATWSM